MREGLTRVFLWLTVFVFMFSAPVFAWQKGNGREGRHQEKFQRMVQELNLSEEQQVRMKEQRQQHREQQQALRQQVKQKREELRQELEKPEIDPAHIQQISIELKELMGQKIDQQIQGILTTKEILTPEQFVQFQEKVKKFRHKQEGKWGRWEKRGKMFKGDKMMSLPGPDSE